MGPGADGFDLDPRFGSGRGLHEIRPPGLDESAEMVSAVLFELNAKTLVWADSVRARWWPPDVTMDSPGEVSGLVLYSATMWTSRVGPRVLRVCAVRSSCKAIGTMDSVLPDRSGAESF